MPKLVPASALSLFTLSLFTLSLFAACVGGGGSAVANTCSSFCQAVLDCFDPTTCPLTDPSATQAACIGDCQAGFTALTPGESTLVEACLQCAVQANPGACPQGSGAGTCSAQCGSAAAKAAGVKWQTANQALASSATVQCGGAGMQHLADYTGFQTCDLANDATSCTRSCCFGIGACTTYDVGFSCTGGAGTAASNCTCTAGKNTGMTVQAAGCAGNVWALCNE